VLSDRSLARRFEYVQELDREMAQHEKADPAWKSTAGGQRRPHRHHAAAFADRSTRPASWPSSACRAWSASWPTLIRRVLKIQYEILQGQKGPAGEGSHRGAAVSAVAARPPRSESSVDDEHQYWPFRGEYWRDELGYYRFRLLNRCEKKRPRAPRGPTGP
jgi:hypothetical protein